MSIRAAVLTISDRSARGERADASGPAIAAQLQELGWQLVATGIIADDQPAIEQFLRGWCEQGNIDIIFTTGGTGFSARDHTPEATLAVIDRAAPGLAEAMRQESLKVTPHAMLSRAVAGIRGQTLIINLPGSPKGALENLRTVLPVLPHAVELLREDPAAEAGHLRQ